MDYEAILVRPRAEAGAEFVGAFARDLAYEWCEVFEAMSYRTTNIVRFQCGTGTSGRTRDTEELS